MTDPRKIPFKVDVRRMLDLLAKQIYQSPLALLRENCQNAYDAILERRALGQVFESRIEVKIERNRIEVIDNGVGMTQDELNNNFWSAGSSGKNTPAARAAGVVGTFGIGAMANFGIADTLEVTTQSARAADAERMVSSARRDQLSATDDCISVESVERAQPGTKIVATIPESNAVNIQQAVNYITEFIKFLDIPVIVNNESKSQVAFSTVFSKPSEAYLHAEPGAKISDHLTCDVELLLGSSGDAWIHLQNLIYANQPLKGEIILKQGAAQIRTFRSRFALAATGAASSYNFGGIINLSNLQPTAGREALTTDSMQFIQSTLSSIDSFVSEKIRETKWSDNNTGFMTWVVQHGRYDYCKKISINLVPSGEQLTLEQLCERSHRISLNYYEGSDQAIRDSYATDEVPLVVPASSNPRRQCQSQYIRAHCKVQHVSDAPQVISVKATDALTFEESALAFRISSILEMDYFLRAEVRFGKMSHGLPMLVDTTNELKITFDSTAGSVNTMLQLYNAEFPAFGSMVKDFVRTTIFPKIANLVPSSTRQGAEAFLNAIRKPREYVEYEMAESDAVKAILGDYIGGKLTFRQAAEQAAQTAVVNYQIVDAAAMRPASTVIPDVVSNARRLEQPPQGEELAALPAITRMDLESPVKLLTIPDGEEPLKGYRCFIAVAERVRRDHAEFFLQPHKTEVVWGGQKVLFVFQHHSARFALYYEMQSLELLADVSGGGAFPTCAIAIKNQVYIPVPEVLRPKFIPEETGRKRFAVRSDLLFPEK